MIEQFKALQFRNATALRRGPIAALDVGSSKIACLIADYQDDMSSHDMGGAGNHGLVRVLGFGQYAATGIKRGQVIDMRAAEESIRSAVSMAERMADREVRRAFVGISAAHLANHYVSGGVPLHGAAVTAQHIDEVLKAAKSQFDSGDNVLLHAIPLSYSIDEIGDIKNPLGMFGATLTAHLYIASAPPSPLRNLLHCIEKCHLECEQPIIMPYASALATLNQDEKDLGVLHIDMGGDTCSLSIFYNGAPTFTAILPIGGHYISADIAYGLNISLAEAERVKKRFGSALSHAGNEREQFELRMSDGDHQIIPCDKLTNIIRPRVEETFESISKHLEQTRPDLSGIRRVVLTGGASKLSGIAEVAEMTLKRKVRLGAPLHINGLPEAATEADYAACVGLLHYAARRPADSILSERNGGNLFARFWSWLRRNI